MTTLDLEQLIEGQTESPNLDFKQDCAWDAKKMAKDIIAMSNLKDGGNIVIGVREDGLDFFAEGVSEHNINSYKVDIMRDQMLKFSDPAVDIKVSFPSDSRGVKFVVIKVFSFREIPVISKTEIAGELKAHTLYYRNSNRRIESAPVSNANDLRDIIEQAAVKLMQRRKAFGFYVEPEDFQVLEEEIRSIPGTILLNKIKSRGYWQISFQPLRVGSLEKLADCKEVVESSQVRLGWSLPWIPRRNDDIERIHPSDRCYEAESELGSRKEFWRMFQSEQFIMYNALTEDWYEDDTFRKDLVERYPTGKFVTLFSSVIHLITQCFTFAERLAKKGLYQDGLRITMTLNKTRGRRLIIDSLDRLPFREPKITMASVIAVDKDYSLEQITQESMTMANEFILKTLDFFAFHPAKEQVLNDQIKFLNGN
jgi:schlafen family protein